MVKVRKCDNTRRRKYSAANLEEAIELVQLKKISVRKAAKLTKVPSSTIQDYIGRGKISEPETVIQQKLERQTALTKKEEKFIARRGCRLENAMDTSKTSTSVMFAAAANGSLLPPYVCSKSAHLYNTWIEIKRNWSSVFEVWKMKNRGIVPKTEFPKLLKETILRTINLSKNIISGFRCCGIHPFDPDQVLKQLPHEEDADEIRARFMEPLINTLREKRFGDQNGEIKRRKRLNIQTGKSICVEDLELNESQNNQPEIGQEEDQEIVDDPTPNDLLHPTVGDFYAVSFITLEDRRTKIYVGKILSIKGEKLQLDFLRKKSGKFNSDYFIYSHEQNIEEVNIRSLVKKMTVKSYNRNNYVFLECTKNYF
ncbi:hypothetical protein PGB90_006227 [Kerria lacca]